LITDATIKKALRDAPTSGNKTTELRDDGARGAGRLTLIIRVLKPKAGTANVRITAEWYALRWLDGGRTKAKIGDYPAMGLAEARRSFTTDFAPAIAKREKLAAPRARKSKLGVTVRDLFQTYVDAMRASGKASADDVERILLTGGEKGGKPAVKALGPAKRAADVTSADIIQYLREIYDRGADSMAFAARAYISAAYNHAIGSENSYTKAAGTVAWGIKVNPVTAVRSDQNARRAGQRYLNQAELCDFWHWLVEQDESSRYSTAARLIICTGQRVSEILRVTEQTWNPDDKMIDWGTTKNGKPHNVPVPEQGVDILEELVMANQNGFYWPSRDDPTVPTEVAVLQLIQRYLEDHPKVPHFTARDLRRTWKTLAGHAGISKEMRDRIQNHSLSDISSKHYDRYEMLPERRAAMEVWSKYLARIIAGEFKDKDVKAPERALEAA
jgi:integrase